MSLHDDPELVIESLRRGLYSQEEAERKINDLVVEINSGAFDIEALGFEKPEDLWQLMPASKEK